MKIEQYKYQEKQNDDFFTRNRTEKRKVKKICDSFYKKFYNIIDPYWWYHLSENEKYVIYKSQLFIPNNAKEIWFKDMYNEYNKKKEIRNSKIDELLTN